MPFYIFLIILVHCALLFNLLSLSVPKHLYDEVNVIGLSPSLKDAVVIIYFVLDIYSVLVWLIVI